MFHVKQYDDAVKKKLYRYEMIERTPGPYRREIISSIIDNVIENSL